MVKLVALLLCGLAAAAAQPVTLRSPLLEIQLNRDTGLPSEYRLPEGAVIHGAEPLRSVSATVFRVSPYGFQPVKVKPQRAQVSATRADFFFTAQYEAAAAASFTLRYELQGAAVFVSLEAIDEKPGFQLIDVGTPDLATVRQEDGGGWLAHGETGGNLIRLAEAKTGHLAPNRFWFGVAATLPVVMVGTAKALCVEEVTAFMDTTELAVAGDPGHRRAELGTVAVHRVNGSLAWDMNANPGKPRVAGNPKTPNLLVEQRPVARLDFAADYDRNGTVDWLDGARIVAARMPEIPTHYYDGRLSMNIHVDEPRWPAPRMTFEQVGKLARAVAGLTAYAPQDLYLWGWQFRGKDTGYPAVTEVNTRAGGRDGLKKLIADARTINANVSFSDNYDDAYKSSPAWDTRYIARRPDGELWLSRNWTGEDSYIIGLAKYMRGPGPDRVRFTCDHYQLRDTTHIDVLSYYPIRNDWDPAAPASGIKNLFEGRYKVLEEFQRHGVDVSSEDLRYAFLGKVSYFWNMPNPTPCPFRGLPIPLAATIYRHSAIWGEGARNRSLEERMLSMLFYNACQHPTTGTHSQYGDFADIFYLLMVPWFKIYNLKVEAFHRQGDETVLELAGDSRVELDWQKQTYKVTLAGREVARNGRITCPLDSNRIAFYTTNAADLDTALPAGWRADNVTASLLGAAGPQAITARVDQGRITVSVPARQPVIVYRSVERATANQTIMR